MVRATVDSRVQRRKFQTRSARDSDAAVRENAEQIPAVTPNSGSLLAAALPLSWLAVAVGMGYFIYRICTA